MDRNTALGRFADAAVLLECKKAAAADLQVALDALYLGRMWQAAGHESWPAACLAHFRVIPKMHAEQRRMVAREMRGEGMTEQAIADALGESQQTIHKDVAQVHVTNTCNVKEGDDVDSRIVDKRGRRQRATRTDPAIMLEKVKAYLQDNPDTTMDQLRAALDIGNGTASKYAQLAGYVWPKYRSATPKPPTQSPRRKPKPARSIGDKPPPDLWVLAQVSGITAALTERNARRILAQYVLNKGTTEPHEGWLNARRDELEYAAAYFVDLVRIIGDRAYTAQIIEEHGGRDDIAGQRITPNLRLVTAPAGAATADGNEVAALSLSRQEGTPRHA